MADRKAHRGCKPDKIMRDALLLSLHRLAEDGVRTKRLQCVADRLVGMAMAGDLAAIREIFDRVDGRPKPKPDADIDNDPREIIVRWQTEEEARQAALGEAK
jgi:hypothetical protein